MKSMIHILPDSVAHMIAAGEVVERPASVVKELMENSLDAQATSITVSVKDSGAELIEVADNGEGMSQEDILMCIKNHATSKISAIEDLEDIISLGFRGEALASIGSVSRMAISSCREGENEGTKIDVEAGNILEATKIAPRKGTIISVKNLFYNTPARRKFLKKASTELRHITAVFRRMALSHPDVSFSLYVNDQKTIDILSGNEDQRVRSLLGEDSANSLIKINEESGGIKVEGFISRPRTGKRSRNDQFLFLNKRFIVNRSISHAVVAGYDTRLARDEFPIYIIYLSMTPRFFDVNVHPAKIEVRFADERFVYSIVKQAVKNALRRPSVVPEFNLSPGTKRNYNFPLVPKKMKTTEDSGQLTLDVQRPSLGDEHFVVQYRKPLNVNGQSTVWQVHDRYIISQIKSGIAIIDQHVAHERVLYEQVIRSRDRKQAVSQQLLFEQAVLLSSEEYQILMEILPYLEKIGFDLKDFGKNTVIIEAVPVGVKNGKEKELLLNIIDDYSEMRGKGSDILDAVAKSYSCKSAIKSGQKLTTQEMESLIDQLFATSEPYFCPHGRPIVHIITLDELDRRFGR
ncbi:DNA mismatch repair endonuclease MutL [bacterium]|nr:DNA mismatch repair endonuclease MutL [bacterium]